jgi:hypothetical protein
MFFSSDNYDDKVERKAGSLIHTRRVTLYLNTVKNLNEDSWAAIFEAASGYLNAGRKKKGRSKSSSSVASSDIYEEPAPEFILLSDDED